MAAKSPLLRLDEMRNAIAAIEEDVRGMSLDAFVVDRRVRWSVERGIEILSEASHTCQVGASGNSMEESGRNRKRIAA